MTEQPKIIEHPGAGRIQEMSLDQYMEALSPDHYARKQLAELRTLALDGMKATQELLKALERNRELEDKLKEYSTPKASHLAIEAGIANAPSDSIHKCVVCGKVTASATGLQAHLRLKHSIVAKIQNGIVIQDP